MDTILPADDACLKTGSPDAYTAFARTWQVLAKTVATGRGRLVAWNASPKLQRAARAFLLRLVAENGVEGAARVLRELADEL